LSRRIRTVHSTKTISVRYVDVVDTRISKEVWINLEEDGGRTDISCIVPVFDDDDDECRCRFMPPVK